MAARKKAEDGEPRDERGVRTRESSRRPAAEDDDMSPLSDARSDKYPEGIDLALPTAARHRMTGHKIGLGPRGSRHRR